MNTSQLRNLSFLSNALSKPLRAQLLGIIDSLYPNPYKDRSIQLVNIYAAFVYSQGHHNFNAISVLNNKSDFQQHLDAFVGFIYEESADRSLKTKATYASRLHNVLRDLAKSVGMDVASESFSANRINDYTQRCIDTYKKSQTDSERLAYLDGWEVTSQERKHCSFNLDFMYVKYGRDFSNKVHNALKRFALTQKTNTLKNHLSCLAPLLETVSALDKRGSVASFEQSINEANVHRTFLKAYQVQLSDCLAKNTKITSFNQRFIAAIDVYQSVFIDTKIYPAPLKPFVKPKIKAVKNAPSFATGGKPSTLEDLRWFADIPLHIKDEQAVEIIKSRLNRDMNHLKSVLVAHFNALLAKQERNKSFIESGWVKPVTSHTRRDVEIGSNCLENTVATFCHYGIKGYDGKQQYEAFLGYRGRGHELNKELNLPTNSTLFTLTALLVIEHPKITPAWLQKLRLFDEHGRRSGYLQVGEQYILTSEKERRGRNLAQQDVVLNEFSKSVVDFIVEHTEIARQHLKALGKPDWKYLLLTSTLNTVTKPSESSQLYKPAPIVSRLLNNKAYAPAEHELTESDIDAIASITTHRSIRRHRGLQIYLETHSQSAVADGLGHKKADPQLLDSYLPQPLMKFFTERVIRQFQKAIILKAMEDSPYLLDAVNMTYEEIEEFLGNHGLNEMPDLNAESFESIVHDDSQSLFDSIVFTITAPLIQLLISIRTIIDTDNDEFISNDLVQHWYQSACYLLNRFELGDFAGNDDIEDMYQTAKTNPLNHEVIKGAIC
ncbi:hypothetical protein BCV02_01245 [Vibrio breoganii]|uniref:Uncharacterized protein n=1 Tax=Vibrio breoganii TaxID=553239 RepID=A0ABX1U6S9_9VIBR|nr:hypothetical protein [Vibrio breoganii]NMO72900.1 hypothetical protein [Vibrio breoganii]NMR68737.1 hypothetical protein [Vibrio breoganii]PMG03935.1 hypothetical protein BCV02_01245 [Vibrio breoganii]PML90987.1 hypothetical protein BCT67_03600 [Vibrio breoganii]